MFEKYSRTIPVNKVRMSWSFAFNSPAHVVASFFGSGVIRLRQVLGEHWRAGLFLYCCSLGLPIVLGFLLLPSLSS